MILNYRSLIIAGFILACLCLAVPPVAADTPQFRVYSNPSGASFCVDYHCGYVTPDDFAATPNAWHTVTVSMPGYQTWSDSVYLDNYGTTVVNANLDPNPPAFGYLDITSFGADIYVDGVSMGNGDQKMPLSPGGHTLLLKKAGYYDHEEYFTITADSTTTLAPGMTPYPQSSPYGDIQVQSVPPGAAVTVNGDYKGTTYPNDPVYVTQLAPGSYTVSLSMADYQTYTETVAVQANAVKTITAPMVPVTPGPSPDTTGQLTVGSIPSGASVYLDSKYRGVTPMVLADIPVGSHTIVLRQNGYQDWTSSVAVTGGGYEAVSGTLVPGAAPATTAPAPAPLPTKSPLPVFIPLAGIGICAALVILSKRA
jgi:hypothetical protein